MDFALVDADNHYYEAEDAFLRYGDESVKGFIRWIEGKSAAWSSVTGCPPPPNPTFNPIAKAGAFHARLKDLEQGQGARN